MQSLPILYNKGLPPIDNDSALFQYIGWTITQGGVPYYDIWEVKPPLIYELAGGLAFLSGGNMQLLHYLSVVLMFIVNLSLIFVIFELTMKVTDDYRAGGIAAASFLMYPATYQIYSGGLQTKPITLMFGFLGLYLAMEHRPILSGFVAAAGAGFWQFGAIFILLCAGIVFQKKGEPSKFVAGVVAMVIITVYPFVIRGHLSPMFTQSVLAPILAPGDHSSIMARVTKLLFLLGYGIPILALGTTGILKLGRERIKDYWWLLIGFAFFVVQIFFFDFDWRGDLLPIVVFLAIGTAVLYDTVKPVHRRGIAGIVALAVLAGPIWVGALDLLPMLGFPEVNAPLKSIVTNQFHAHHPRIESIDDRHGMPTVVEMYWGQILPPRCHVNLSGMEIEWIESTQSSYTDRKCNQVGIEILNRE